MKSFRSVWQKFMLGNEHTGAIPIQQDIHKKSLFYRLFYYSQFYSQLRMSYTTRLLLVSYCLFLSYSILGMESLVLPIALVLLSLIFLADALLGQIFVPKLDLQRKLPDSCVSGASFTVIYTLTNKRKVSAYNLILDHYNYPGLKKVSGVACVDYLAPGASISLTAEFVLSDIGRARLPATYVATCFPFGLWKTGHFGQGENTIWVYPARVDTSQINVPPNESHLQDEEEAHRLSSGNNMLEFSKLREYVPGDSPRHIHWPSSARMQEICVIEYADNTKAEMAVYFDLKAKRKWWTLKPQKVNDFDLARSLAASLVAQILNRNYHLSVLALGGNVFHFSQSMSQAEILNKVMQALAEVEPIYRDEITQFEKTKEQVFRELKQRPSVAVFTSIDSTRKRFFEQVLERKNIQTFSFEDLAEGNNNFHLIDRATTIAQVRDFYEKLD